MLDHLIFGVPVLEDGVRQLETRWGVRAQPGGHHQGLGTHNALLGLGQGTYLELIAPDPDRPPPVRPRPFGLDALDHPRLVAWAVRGDDLEARVAHARAQGYDPGDPLELQRTTAQGTPLRWRLTPKALAGGPIPFLIDWGDAVHPSGSAPTGLTLGCRGLAAARIGSVPVAGFVGGSLPRAPCGMPAGSPFPVPRGGAAPA
jgi:hypothetical protein